MLARTPAHCQTAAWRRELGEAYTRPEALLDDLGLASAAPSGCGEAARLFPFLVPRAYAANMRRGDGRDPLLRQVLPSALELVATPGYSRDPVGDAAAVRAPGLLRKYPGRALLMVTGACAVHCRYCFRRHFPYGELALRRDRGPDPVRVIAGDPAISEVILSGGDPLTWDDCRIAELVARLSTVRHLRRLRIHTRLPVVLPSRVTPELCAILGGTRLKALVVVQVNHPQELSRDVHAALAALREAGAPLMNQGVLLRGVNDNARTLGRLSEALFDCGVIPYYLHRLDPVAGAAHFDVPPGRARALMERLRTILPGYLVPRLVREAAGGSFKQPVT